MAWDEFKLTEEEMHQIIREYEQFIKAGFIGDCTLRTKVNELVKAYNISFPARELYIKSLRYFYDKQLEYFIDYLKPKND